jgi:enoyl-CoA hydratase
VNESVQFERRGPAAWLTLNRPTKLNAVNSDVIRGLHDAMDRAVEDDEVKVVVLTGAGAAFSAGYDLADNPANSRADGWHAALGVDVAVTMRLWELPKPTVAAVRGWCLGGACELAMACDLIVATEDARFGEPEIRLASGPVTLLMPFVLGQKKTNELLLTGDDLTASEAERHGLINRVVASPDQLEAEVTRLVQKIAPTPLPVLRLTKLALTRAYEAMGLRQAVQANLDLSSILNGADIPEQREFDQIAAEQGLKAALSWRDARYSSPMEDMD